jgi:DNA-binding NtrC family response regulator
VLEIVAVSPEMRRALAIAERVAVTPSASTLLILGESGTGKDLLARYVHDRSGTAGPLVSIDCAALPESLVEAELFGHEKGAFTGAVEARPGRLMAARGGTLVLDEVAALTLQAQAKLLRVLDERCFQPLGGRRTIALDAKVVALTNVDLCRAADAGAFRADLFFRLNVVNIVLPPLREQPAAVRPLAETFLRRFAHGQPGARMRFADGALRLLELYRFPGNVRELRNIVEHLVISGAGPSINSEDLPPHIAQSVVGGTKRARTLAEVESDYVRSVLADSRGNKALAARVLGISRKNLYERLRRMEQEQSCD